MEPTETSPEYIDPVDALIHAHRLILERMTVMEELANEVLEFGAPAWKSQQDKWRQIAEFFRGPLAMHTVDEEEGLFPLMSAAAPDRVEMFHFDHSWISQSEEIFLERYEAFSRNGDCDSTACREFALEALEIVRHYRQHIRQEEHEIFPLAQDVLTDTMCRELSEWFRERHAKDAAGAD